MEPFIRNFIYKGFTNTSYDRMHLFTVIKSRHEMGCMMTVRMIAANGDHIWVNIVMHVKQALMNNSDEPVIVCINQVVRYYI